MFNNSTAAELIAILSFRVNDSGGQMDVESSVTKTHISAPGVAGVPLVTGEAAPAGLFESGTIAAAPAFDYFFANAQGIDEHWPHEYPFAILQPGWMWQLVNATQNRLTVVSILWQALFPEELVEFEKLTGSDF